ncbi:E3 ubiquitin-protein ligase HRD1-like protein [Dinothrombium tinctorium]|uniref:E3 ubiquitin-protein ligase HRD1-like protein n=1 Tax=Dinothrombium tinctorium TaxID=1965070 RepID=A0A443RAZ9_9ACAR|nr:E3 ubiquitin-protein ligase HRD1-like protein [Dinothrombium tinctorium]RWS12436.1 E3 ubiquitin-protein ligase HRD1-like protein [Dinothrombium tinctorium]RWS14975.1 E3 ubiquitin-protein ligase HRD1-like protein [Dinothrombium tinctorium]
MPSRRSRVRRSQQLPRGLYSRSISTSSTDSSSSSLLCASPGMAIFFNQAMFFLLCDKWFCPRQKLTGLYSLLFYNVASYLISYAKELIMDSKRYSLVVRISEHSNIKHLAMTATKVVLDLTKFVTFAITCVFILLVFGVPGQNHFSPTWCHIAITFLYYILTDPWTHENAAIALSWLELECLENLEVLWTPVLIRLLASLLSGVFISLVWFFSSPSSIILLIASAYINVYLCLQEMDIYWKVLMEERSYLNKYRYATNSELTSKCDDVCAVCLLPMRWKARVTPCQHMFHSDCLRRCLKQNLRLCPICKQEM